MEVEAMAKVAFVCHSCHMCVTALTTDGGISPTHSPIHPPQGVGLENLAVDGLMKSAVYRVHSQANQLVHVEQQHALPIVAKPRVTLLLFANQCCGDVICTLNIV